MNKIGFFSEMEFKENNGSVKDHIVESVNYDKNKVIQYLESFEHRASCPRDAIDCVTGEIIASYFLVYTDGEYDWCDFLIYHIKKYNIELPEEFIKKAGALDVD